MTIRYSVFTTFKRINFDYIFSFKLTTPPLLLMFHIGTVQKILSHTKIINTSLLKKNRFVLVQS